MLGNLISEIGNVSIEVIIGDADHALKDWTIRRLAMMKLTKTVIDQQHFDKKDFDDAMYESPWIVDTLKNSFKSFNIFSVPKDEEH